MKGRTEDKVVSAWINGRIDERKTVKNKNKSPVGEVARGLTEAD